MKLTVKDDLYISNDSDLVSAPFYLEYEGYVFPDSKWTDFPYPVLQNWAWMILKRSIFLLHHFYAANTAEIEDAAISVLRKYPNLRFFKK